MLLSGIGLLAGGPLHVTRAKEGRIPPMAGGGTSLQIEGMRDRSQKNTQTLPIPSHQLAGGGGVRRREPGRWW
jgi:hypothetical protein